MARAHVDFGHGGKDPGAVGNGLKEKDINLVVGLKVGQILERHKVIVTYSRTTDVFVDLTPRAIKSDNAKADMFVSIHCNAHDSDAKGLEILYNKGSVKGKILAQSIQDSILKDKLYTIDRGLKERDNVTVLAKTKAPAALVEMAFITNVQDAQFLKFKQSEFAKAIAKGILDYLGIKYVEESNKINLNINGKKLEIKGYEKNNINYMAIGEIDIPIRDVLELLGFTVTYDAKNETVIAK